MGATLTAKEVNSATPMLEGTPAETTTAGKDKRCQTRRACRIKGNVFIFSKGSLQVIPIVTMELSQGGVGFQSIFPFAVDQEFILNLPYPNATFALTCRTKHVAQLEHYYVVGAMIEEIHKESMATAVPSDWLKVIEAVVDVCNVPVG